MLAADFFHVDCAVTLQRLYCFFVIGIEAVKIPPRSPRAKPRVAYCTFSG
jgi:hypothetical protein